MCKSAHFCEFTSSNMWQLIEKLILWIFVNTVGIFWVQILPMMQLDSIVVVMGRLQIMGECMMTILCLCFIYIKCYNLFMNVLFIYLLMFLYLYGLMVSVKCHNLFMNVFFIYLLMFLCLSGLMVSGKYMGVPNWYR